MRALEAVKACLITKLSAEEAVAAFEEDIAVKEFIADDAVNAYEAEIALRTYEAVAALVIVPDTLRANDAVSE
jgi:hypothetical protein